MTALKWLDENLERTLVSILLAAMVLLIVPAVIVPILVLGRRLRKISRENQDWIAASSGNASEALLSVQTVQAFTHENASRKLFGDVTEESYRSAKKRVNTRALLTVIIIFLVFCWFFYLFCGHKLFDNLLCLWL